MSDQAPLHAWEDLSFPRHGFNFRISFDVHTKVKWSVRQSWPARSCACPGGSWWGFGCRDQDLRTWAEFLLSTVLRSYNPSLHAQPHQGIPVCWRNYSGMRSAGTISIKKWIGIENRHTAYTKNVTWPGCTSPELRENLGEFLVLWTIVELWME